jgi:hypothetical protein
MNERSAEPNFACPLSALAGWNKLSLSAKAEAILAQSLVMVRCCALPRIENTEWAGEVWYGTGD